jgi:hypothetical protein
LFPGLAVGSVDLAVAVEVAGDADAQLRGAAAGDANQLGAGFADAQEAGDFSVHVLLPMIWAPTTSSGRRREACVSSARITAPAAPGGVDRRCDFTVAHTEGEADCLIGIQLAAPGVGIACWPSSPPRRDWR